MTAKGGSQSQTAATMLAPSTAGFPIHDAAHVRNAMLTLSRADSDICHPEVAKRETDENKRDFA
jgi:hypothetical protein